MSPEGNDGALRIHQDARIYLGRFESSQETELALLTGRHAWVQVVRGKVSINGTALQEGDGAAVSNEKKISIRADNDTEFLLFDLG